MSQGEVGQVHIFTGADTKSNLTRSNRTKDLTVINYDTVDKE